MRDDRRKRRDGDATERGGAGKNFQESGESEEALERLIERWKASDARVWNSSAGWRRFLSRVSYDSRTTVQPLLRKHRVDRGGVRSRRRTSRQAVMIGGILLLAGFVAWVGATAVLDRPAAEAIVMREVATDNAQRAQITLSDGSKVRLNVASRLTMPVYFSDNMREVSLTGEAYFEIEPDDARPFFVNAGDAVIHVVGTSFNVEAYDDLAHTDVVVTSGRVTVKHREALDPAEVTLGKDQFARLSRNGDLSVTADIRPDVHTGWLTGRLRFRDTPFREVVSRLARWYDLDITISDPSMLNLRLTAAFQDETRGEVLRVIAGSLGLAFDRQGRRVHFRHPHEAPVWR